MRRVRAAAVGAALTVTAGVLASVMVAPAAMAGTGGSDAVGIFYGEGSRYCEVANMAVQKRDASTGAPLAGFTLRVTAEPVVGVKAGIYNQGSKVSDVMDRDLWMRTFNQAADQAFTATDFGAMYKKAMLLLVESQGEGEENGGRAGDGGTGFDYPHRNPGSGTEANQGGTVVVEGTYSGMIYTTDAFEDVFYPVDVREVAPAARQAALQNWVTADGFVVLDPEGNPKGSWAVSDFSKRVKMKMDAVGKVGYFDYRETSPKHPLLLLTGPIVSGMQFTQDSVGEQYRYGYDVYAAIKAAVKAAGYPNAVFAADGTITPGPFQASSQNWDAFVTAYDRIVDNDRFPYGIQPADFELVRNVVGEVGMVEANHAAHRAVGATFRGDGSAGGSVSLVTDADGRVEYSVFGRIGARTSGVPTAGSCSELLVQIKEMDAPSTYAPDLRTHWDVPRDLIPEEGFLQTLTLPSTRR